MAKDAKGHGSEGGKRKSVWDRMSSQDRAKMSLQDAARKPRNTYQVARDLERKARPNSSIRSIRATTKNGKY